jgi:hypothetical protein
MNPNDYLSVEMRIGSRRVNVLNKNNKIVLGARGTSDKDALRRVCACVESLLEERGLKNEVRRSS